MAQITKRGALQWRARVRREGWPDQSRTFETRDAAVRWARRVEREIDQGCYVDQRLSERTTLHSLIARYIAEVLTDRRADGPESGDSAAAPVIDGSTAQPAVNRPRSLKSVKKGAKQEMLRLQAWQKSDLARRPVAAVRAEDLAQWRDARLATGKADATVTHDLAVLSAVFTHARREWSMPSLPNPVKDVKKPGLGKPRDRRLVGDEETRLLDGCESGPSWLRPMVIVALETAMRQGELRTMAWRDVDLVEGVAVLRDTKNGDKREVPLSTRARAALREIPVAIDGGSVFNVRQSQVVNAFIAACRRGKIRGLRFHDLRHEATSRLIERGLNIVEAASVTGHKSLQMLKRYTHPRAADLARRLG